MKWIGNIIYPHDITYIFSILDLYYFVVIWVYIDPISTLTNQRNIRVAPNIHRLILCIGDVYTFWLKIRNCFLGYLGDTVIVNSIGKINTIVICIAIFQLWRFRVYCGAYIGNIGAFYKIPYSGS